MREKCMVSYLTLKNAYNVAFSSSQFDGMGESNARPPSHYDSPVPRYTCPVPRYTCPVPRYTCPVPRYTCPVARYTCPVHGRIVCFKTDTIPGQDCSGAIYLAFPHPTHNLLRQTLIRLKSTNQSQPISHSIYYLLNTPLNQQPPTISIVTNKSFSQPYILNQPSSQPTILSTNHPLNILSTNPLNQPSSQPIHPLNQPSSQPTIHSTNDPLH